MIEIDIPGNKKIEAKHLLLDYNGTLAVDGYLIPEVKGLLFELSKKINIHIITADTFGKVKEEMQGDFCTIKILNKGNEQFQKSEYLQSLNADETICIGNGLNDEFILKQAALCILVIGQEGSSGSCFRTADIVCNNIIDALYLLHNPKRIMATLRK